MASLLCLWNSPGKNTGVGRHSLLQGIFPTQRSNPGILHCRQIHYSLNHQGSSKFSLRLCLIVSLLKFVPYSNPLIILGCQQTGMPSVQETTTQAPTKWKGKIVKKKKKKTKNKQKNKKQRKIKLIKQHQPKFLKVY